MNNKLLLSYGFVLFLLLCSNIAVANCSTTDPYINDTTAVEWVPPSTGFLTISWNSVSGVTGGYIVEYRVVGTTTWTSEPATLSTSYTKFTPTPCITYEFRIITICPAGIATGNTITFTSGGCPYIPGGSSCVNQSTVNRIPYIETGFHTGNFGDDYDDNSVCYSSYMNGNDFLFKYTPTSDQAINIYVNKTIAGATGLFVTHRCPDQFQLDAECVAMATSDTGNVFLENVCLQMGYTYTITVATDPNGVNGAQSTPFDIAIFNSNPIACTPFICETPANFTATPISINSIQLNWTAASGASNYVGRYRKSGTSAWTSFNTTNTDYTLTTIDSCKAYEFQIRADCSQGVSNYSATITTSTNCITCEHPPVISFSGSTSTSLTIDWDDMSNATEYRIAYRTIGGSWVYASSSVSNYTITGLSSCTSYIVTVATICGLETSMYAPTASFGTSGCAGTGCFNALFINTLPYQHSNLTTNGSFYDSDDACNSTYLDGDDFVFRYTPSSNEDVTISLSNTTASNIGLFVFDGCPDLATTNCFAIATAPSNPSLTTCLIANTTYYIIVSNQATFFGATSTDFDINITSTGSCVLQVCDPPILTGATNITDTTATLNWNAQSGASNYELFAREVGSVNWVSGSTSDLSINYINLVPCTTYEYTVRSICSNGTTSALSNIVQFSTSCCTAPTTLDTLNVTTTNATLVWDGVIGQTYSIRYRVVGDSAWTFVGTYNFPTSTSYNLTGLSECIYYEYQVQQFCIGSSSAPYSDPFAFETTCSCPPPLNVSAIADTTVIAIAWDNSPTANSYLIRYRISGGTWNFVVPSSNPYNLQNLVACTDYEIEVAAVCGIETSTYSNTITPTTIGCLPPCITPYNITANLDATSIDLTWDPYGATQYTVRYREAGTILWTYVGVLTNNISLTGLSTCTDYEVQIESNCNGMLTGYSGSQIFQTTNCPLPCTTPTGLSAMVLDSNTVQLDWDTSGAVQYIMRYRVRGTSFWSYLASLDNTITLNTLPACTDYEYQVQADCNGTTTNYSTIDTFSTTGCIIPCLAPSNPTVNTIGGTHVSLSWTPTYGSSQYVFRYREAGSVLWSYIGILDNAIDLSGLDACTSYEYQIDAECGGSFTGYSPLATFTTTCDCKRDTYEPNNTNTAASMLYSGSGASAFGRTYICPAGDIDWFKFEVTSNQSDVMIRLSNLRKNYQLELYDANNLMLASSYNANTSDEQINQVLTQGSYYVKIYGLANTDWNPTDAYIVQILFQSISNTGATKTPITSPYYPSIPSIPTAPVGGNKGWTNYYSFKVGTNIQSLKLYPNPATHDRTTLVFEAEQSTPAELKIIDLYGRILQSQLLTVEAGMNKRVLQLNGLTEGLYLITLQSETENQVIKMEVIK